MWLLLILALKLLAVKEAVAGAGDESDPGKFLIVQTVSALTNVSC